MHQKPILGCTAGCLEVVNDGWSATRTEGVAIQSVQFFVPPLRDSFSLKKSLTGHTSNAFQSMMWMNFAL